MKKSFCSIFVISLLFSSLAQAQRLKIATVSMEDLFNNYYKTTEVQRDINIKRARIQRDNNVKLGELREIDNKIQRIRDQLSDPSLGEKRRRELTNESKVLSQDGISRERERNEYLDRRNQALSNEMRKEMRSILFDIQRAVEDLAKSANYDYIFDTSGNSTQGIPIVLHARETTDLTEQLLKKINAGHEKPDTEKKE